VTSGDADEIDWGANQELTALETLMWRADVDPAMRSTVTGIEVLDRAPDRDRLVSAHQWAIRAVPRLCDRLREPLGLLGDAIWLRDPNFSLGYHLRRVRVGGGGGGTDLLTLAAQVAMTPFDRARPPWGALLVEGLPDEKAAYVLKVHHSLSDGIGLIALLSHLHSRHREPKPNKPHLTVASPPRNGLTTFAGRQVRRNLSAIPDLVRSGSVTLQKGTRHPLAYLKDGADYARSARRVLSPPPTPGLPLLASRGTSWRFVALDVAYHDLRAAARAVDGSLNDAFLAALLAGFRRYHEQMTHPLLEDAVMPVSVPVSVRRVTDRGGGNRFAPTRLLGPVGVRDPGARIAEIRARMLAARAEPALQSADYLAPLLTRIPASIMVRLASATTGGNDLQASNVPGIREDAYLAGSRIERMYPFAPLPGCAAMITLTSHVDTCCVGANLDAHAVSDDELFRRCLRDGFAEVLTLHPGSAAPRLLA
jgi:diacylglycerol O-acyltransferase